MNTFNARIIKLNDLYFPQGNENGDIWEPYYKAISGDSVGYGSSPNEAVSDLEKNIKNKTV